MPLTIPFVFRWTCHPHSFMESVQMITKVSSCKSFSNPLQAKFTDFRVLGKLGLAPLWRRRSRSGCLRLRASNSGGSQDAVEEERQEKGLVLGTERDGSGSVIGFPLIPQSGIYHYIL